MITDAPEAPTADIAALSRHELRVLRGLHAGARTPLRESEGAVSIGRTNDNDIVLRDSPDSLAGGVITLDAGGWTWIHRAGAKRVTLPFGSAVRHGSAVITVDDAQAPWPDAGTLVLEADAPEASDAAEPASDESTTASENVIMATNSPAASEPSPVAADAPSAAGPPAAATKTLRARVRAWLRAPMLLVLVAGGAAAIWASVSLLTTPATQAAVPPRVAPSVSADTVREVIGALGLSDSVKVLTTKSNGLEVVGVVDSDNQRDELRERLSALQPAPLSTVLTRPEFKTEVDALARTLEPGLKLVVQGRGKLVMSGIVGDPQEVDALSHRIAAELPSAVQVEKAVKTPPEIVAEFSAELSRLGLPMRARWEDRHMHVEGKLPNERIAQWEALLLRFNKQYGERIPFSASLDDDSPARTTRSPAAPVQNPMLTGINSIVGGDAPYVVLADGRKINIGGSVNGYELVAIRNDSLVVRAGQGPLREVPR